MKMSTAQYAALKAALAPLMGKAGAHREALRNDPRVKDLEKRLRWDLLWASRFDVCPFYKEGMDDTHIDTALKKAVKELAA